jgi:hypothetical protein
LFPRERRRADIRDIDIRDSGADGINAKDTDLNVNRFSISNANGNGISHDGKGSVIITNGIISSPKGHGIVIGSPTTDDVMGVIREIIESQDDAKLREILDPEIQKFKQTQMVDERKTILKSIVDVLIQRGLGTAVEEGIKGLGGSLQSLFGV